MITFMHIENFKCFKDFDIDLGPFNVLIGPNDSGKTALLQAVLLATVFPGDHATLDHADIGTRVGVGLGTETPHGGISSAKPTIHICHQPSGKDLGVCHLIVRGSASGQQWTLRFGEGRQVLLGKVSLAQFDPSRMRKPTRLSEELHGSGEGLPAFFARLSINHPRARDSLEAAFCKRFPFYRGIQVPSPPKGQEELLAFRFPTVQGQHLPAASVSDGVMVSLGFLAVLHDPEPPSILLVEEPENHVHHASLKDIVTTLKQLSAERDVQVILTTHSPYLLDEVSPDEVYVFQKDEQGAVHARKLSEFEGAGEISDMFSTGEKWSMLSERYGI